MCIIQDMENTKITNQQIQDSTNTKVALPNDDTDELVTQCSDLFAEMIPVVKAHFNKTKLKSSCQVTIDFIPKKDEDGLSIKTTPKLTLPQLTQEQDAEVTVDGQLRLL